MRCCDLPCLLKTKCALHLLFFLPTIAPSITHLKIRLRGQTNNTLATLSNILQTPQCNISRLELDGQFGDEGILLLSEALKTNATVRTITIGYSENLTDVGGNALLQVSKDVYGTGTWESVTESNNTLKSVYISERVAGTVSQSLITTLQTLTNEDPHRTLQSKVWKYLQTNMDFLPQLDLQMIHMPKVLAFIDTKGGQNSMYQVLRGGYFPNLFINPTPERVRLTDQMKQLSEENTSLREMLREEQERTRDLEVENERIKMWFEDRGMTSKCCLMPIFKVVELWKRFVDILRVPVK
eukprot:scaffold571_cov175-Alexandrium_tamarense.AAC.5